MRLLRHIAAAILIGVPVGAILTFLLPRLLWRLEQIFALELAGHSGPSEWIFWTGTIITSIGSFLLIHSRGRRR